MTAFEPEPSCLGVLRTGVWSTDESAGRSGWWVNVSRVTPTEEVPDVALGPYADREAAVAAMESSLLVESEVQDGCDDCWVTDDGKPAEGHRLVLIDPNDPHHHGAELPVIWDTVAGSACDGRGLNCCYLPSTPPAERRCVTCGIELKEGGVRHE